MSRIIITAVLIIGFILGFGFQQSRISALKADHATTLLSISQSNQRALKALEHYNQTVQSRLAQLREENYEANQKINTLVELSNSERAEWLRKLADAARSSKSSTSATRSSSESDKDTETFDMLIGLLDRHSRTLEDVGAYADRLYQAGLKCERSVDATHVPQSTQLD